MNIPSFAEILIQEREKHNKTPEVIALLCNISVEAYKSLEEGKLPSASVLKKLCVLFEWNYYEYKKFLMSDSDRQTHLLAVSNAAISRGTKGNKTRFAREFPSVSSSGDIKQLCRQIQTDADSLNLEAARIVSLQLSLIQQTIHHLINDHG